jgi:hypothetical protein
VPVQTQDKPWNDSQQDTNDQSQLPIVNFPESESAENPIIEVQTLDVEVNFLIYSNFFFNFILFICTSYAGSNNLISYCSEWINNCSP